MRSKSSRSSALASGDELMETLVLKGGNAVEFLRLGGQPALIGCVSERLK